MKMNKAILRNGMHVILRNGDEYVIMNDMAASLQKTTETMVGLKLDMCDVGFIRIDMYNDDLTTYTDNHEYDVMFVYVPQFYKYILSSIKTNRDKFNLIAVR